MTDFDTTVQMEKESWAQIEQIVSELDSDTQQQIKQAIYQWTENFMKVLHAGNLELYQMIQERQLQTTSTETEIG